MAENRIDTLFSDLRASGGRALMPFLTAGDPDLATTAALLESAQGAGASVCEIGIPFSDPIADGPVIQASMSRALDAGVRVDAVLDMVRGVRERLSIGLVAMVSYSIVHRLGLEAFVKRSKDAGLDGFIFPDLPLEESGPARAAAAEAGLILSMLIAPTTPIERAERIAAASTGFVYVVSRPGITGASAALPEELPQRLRRLRGVTGLPMAVGFGVSSAAQVREVVGVADAAIVGSALVKVIDQARGGDVVARAGGFMQELASGLTAASPEAASPTAAPRP